MINEFTWVYKEILSRQVALKQREADKGYIIQWHLLFFLSKIAKSDKKKVYPFTKFFFKKKAPLKPLLQYMRHDTMVSSTD